MLIEDSKSQEYRDFVDWEKNSTDCVDFKCLYVDIAGGDLIAGLLLSQIIYWFLPSKKKGVGQRVKKEKDGKKWLIKRRTDWYPEIRMTVPPF